MTLTRTLTLTDGVQIVVPDNLDSITSYVLQEQLDWFEDEIKFVRRLLQPGQRVVDIGANYGVYTLCMAHKVGPHGAVWAFEPTATTADLLSRGIAANEFTHVTLERSAISHTKGTAHISLNANSELNGIIHQLSAGHNSELVPLMTLDDCMDRYNWNNIDFIKIDAEGEEANILKGGVRFFADHSPLVLYEVKAGEDLHLDLVEAFARIGYRSYRLVPALNLLIPFDSTMPPDNYLLNLFCCKQDRAITLAASGLLLETDDPGATGKSMQDTRNSIENRDRYHWRTTLANLPYGIRMTAQWELSIAVESSAAIEDVLELYAISADPLLPMQLRFNALQASIFQLRSLCDEDPSHLRLATLARVAGDFGCRFLAVDALTRLSETILHNGTVDVSEPFLVPCRRFDLIAPGDGPKNWILASVLEQLELIGTYSSFYSRASALPRLETIHELGFSNAEMQRRLNMVRQRLLLNVPNPSTCPSIQTRSPSPASEIQLPRYLLVKAHVGFGDRLQCLSHAIDYAAKFSRTLCIDWSDSIWSDGTLGFETFFDLCNVPTIVPDDFLRLEFESVRPSGWANQLDRRADSKFIYKSPYTCSLAEADHDAQVLVYASTGYRTFYQANLSLLRVKREFRNLIVAELKKFAEFQTVVHLRGTDRNGPAQHEAYLQKISASMSEVSTTEPLLVVTDCLSLFQQFQSKCPGAVLRTPHLDQFISSSGTHFQSVVSKHDFNLQLLIDFFLIIYAKNCVSDGESLFSTMARFLRGGDYTDLLGYDA